MRNRTRKQKKYPESRKTERLGVNLVERIVLEMGFVWNEILVESGIDGQIELVDSASGSPTNRIVMVQVKGVLNKFQSESDDALSYSCERAHIDYWLGGTAPVILVVCRPATGEAYWKDLKSYFADPEKADSCTVRFDKKEDKFDTTAAPLVANIAAPEGGHSLGLLPKEEILVSNLFPIEFFPETIWSGKSKFRGKEKYVSALRDLRRPEIRELIQEDGNIYSFRNLSEKPLVGLVEPGTIEGNPSSDWAESNDPAIQRRFVQLLNHCLRQFCHTRRILPAQEYDTYFCEKDSTSNPRKFRCKALENEGTRSLAEWHPSKKVPGEGYYRHHAFAAKFLKCGGAWHLEITPTYCFTTDGRNRHRNSELLLSGIKRLERNRAVVGHLLMWQWLFCNPNTSLFPSYPMLKFSPPLEFSAAIGIDDEMWKRGGKVPDFDEEEGDDELEAFGQTEMDLW